MKTYHNIIYLSNGKKIHFCYKINDGNLHYLTCGDAEFYIFTHNLLNVLYLFKEIIFIPKKHIKILEKKINEV